jgi:hypothetical protein
MTTLDGNKLRYRVNEFFDIRDVLQKMGYHRIDFGERIRCPNHDDRNPDCEVYEDGAYCYVCRENWDVYDLLNQFMNVPKQQLSQKVPELDADYEPPVINDGYDLEPIKREWLHGGVNTQTMIETMLECVGKDYKLVKGDD